MALTRTTRTTLWTAIGLTLSWVLLSILWAPPHMIATTPYPVDQTPATRNLDYQDITIPSGDLQLESRDGEGATFIISLPDRQA